MHGFILALAQARAPESTSLFQRILESLPTDPASLVTLALALGATVLVIVTGRRSSGDGKDASQR